MQLQYREAVSPLLPFPFTPSPVLPVCCLSYCHGLAPYPCTEADPPFFSFCSRFLDIFPFSAARYTSP